MAASSCCIMFLHAEWKQILLGLVVPAAYYLYMQSGSRDYWGWQFLLHYVCPLRVEADITGAGSSCCMVFVHAEWKQILLELAVLAPWYLYKQSGSRYYWVWYSSCCMVFVQAEWKQILLGLVVTAAWYLYMQNGSRYYWGW